MKKVLTLVLLWMVSVFSYANTLDDHISKHCKVGCVDSYTLLNATTQAADKYGLDFKLLIAIVTVESGFILLAKNRGNVGLTQVLLKYHRDKFTSKKKYFDPYENVNVGASILRACMKNNHTTKKALRCYNSIPNDKYSKKVLVAFNEVKHITF